MALGKSQLSSVKGQGCKSSSSLSLTFPLSKCLHNGPKAPTMLQTHMSIAHSTTNEQPWGREPVNGIFVVLMPLWSPPRSLVRPAPLMGASPVGGTDPRAGLLPSLASLLSTGSRTAVSSGAPSCTPALSGQSQGGQDRAITPSPCLHKHPCHSLALGPSAYK